jgi:hypothetical protein
VVVRGRRQEVEISQTTIPPHPSALTHNLCTRQDAELLLYALVQARTGSRFKATRLLFPS